MIGKYSPTVSRWYSKNRNWWKNNGPHDKAHNYDKEGYDRYGYNEHNIDRAGNHEDDYFLKCEYRPDGEMCFRVYEQVYNSWYEDAPTGRTQEIENS